MTGNFWREIITIILISLLIYAGINATIQNSEVEGPSMTPTLEDGERVIISKLSYSFGNTPQRGDIIVFTPPSNVAAENDFIKRVIGLPGEVVEISGGKVYVTGHGGVRFQLDESEYVSVPATYTYKSDVIDADSYFVLGDNRNNSYDSHTGWLVTRDSILGKAWLVIWPPAAWGSAPNYSVQMVTALP